MIHEGEDFEWAIRMSLWSAELIPLELSIGYKEPWWGGGEPPEEA